jgi:hypothetical protein
MQHCLISDQTQRCSKFGVDREVQNTMDQPNVLNSAQEVHRIHVVEQLQSLYQDKTLCDVTVIAEDCSIQAHKLILAANSDYFRAMFSGNWPEKLDSHVILHGLTPAGLKAIVEFAYHGVITADHNDMMDVFSAIKYCQIEKAFPLFEEFLSGTIEVSNFLDLLEFSEVYSLRMLYIDLILFATKFILPSLDASVIDVMSAFKVNFFDIVLRLWKPSNSGLGYIAACDVIVRWANHDIENRRIQFREVFADFEYFIPFDYLGMDMANEAMEYCQLNPAERRKAANTGGLYFLSTSMSAPNIVVHSVHDKSSRLVPPFSQITSSTDLKYSGKAVLDNKLYVLGGEDEAVTDRCQRYDPCRDRWLSIRPLSTPRMRFAVVEFEGKLMVLGGMNDKGEPVDIVEVYDPDFNTWCETSFPLPHRVHSHAATVHQGCIYMSGGCSQADGCCSGKFFRFDQEKFSWTEKEEAVTKRCSHTLVGHKNRLFQIGGSWDMEHHPYTTILSDFLQPRIEYFDLGTDGPWTELCLNESQLYSHPYAFGACNFDDLLLLCALTCLPGEDASDSDAKDDMTIIAYDPETCEVNHVFEIQRTRDESELFHQLLVLRVPPCVFSHYKRYQGEQNQIGSSSPYVPSYNASHIGSPTYSYGSPAYVPNSPEYGSP